jgi:hypothetical protein
LRRTKKALTDDALRKIAAPLEGARIVHAGGIAGLRYRVRASGRREFVLRYTAAGVTKDLALGVHGTKPPAFTAEKARKRAGEILADVRKGADPIADRRAARTAAAAQRTAERAGAASKRALEKGEALPESFAALARLYLRDPARAAQRAESRRAFVSVVEREPVPAWGNRPAGEISRGDVYALGSAVAAGEGKRRKRPGKLALVAVATAVKLASTIFNFGLDVGFPGLVGNPCARVIRRGTVDVPRRSVNKASKQFTI